MDIYTSEQTKSYSGVHVHEIVQNGVSFGISKGMAGSVRAYCVGVKHYEQRLFTIYTYEGDELYNVIDRRVDTEIAAKVFHSAFFHMSITKFLDNHLMLAYNKGWREGKNDVQAKMREVLGIEPLI